MAEFEAPFVDWLDAGGRAAPFEEQWAKFLELDAARGPTDPPVFTWRPTADEAAVSNPGRLLAHQRVEDVRALHAWSIRERAEFWRTVIAQIDVRLTEPADTVLDLADGVEHAHWLPGARLNIAESCFSGDDPDAPAVLLGREGETGIETTSRAELRRLADRFAHGLVAAGLEPGDAVALYMPMNLECVAAYLGTVLAGMRVVSIADSFPPREIARRLEIGGARLVVTVESWQRGGKRVELLAKVREAGGVPAVVVPGDRPFDLAAGDRAWDDFLGADEPFAAVACDPDAPTNILFSSGTTGTPKAIPWTHLTPVKGAMDGLLHHDIRVGDVVAWPTNIGWMMGPWLIYASLLNGAAMALFQGSPGGAEFTAFVGEAGVTMLGVVPSLVRAWRANGAAEAVAWPQLRVFSSTGEPSSREDYLWLTARTGHRAPVIEYCGGTEIGGGHLTGSVLQPASPSTFTTPAFGLDFVVLDADGRPVADGETGELFVVPPSIGLSQTLLNADHHAVYHEGCPRGPDGSVLRRHGDAVERLPTGYWQAHGRADDTMNLGGIKVSSREIEQVVDAHPDVYEGAAVAVPAGGGGPDRLVLFVVPNGTPDPGALRADLGRRIAADLNPLFKVHAVVLETSLPRTASNKLMRRTLRAGWNEGAA